MSYLIDDDFKALLSNWMRLLKVATWTEETGGLRTDSWGMFIIIGKIWEGESEEAPKRVFWNDGRELRRYTI